jgi:hypothetical protein
MFYFLTVQEQEPLTVMSVNIAPEVDISPSQVENTHSVNEFVSTTDVMSHTFLLDNESV